MEALVGPDSGVHSGSPGGAPTLTEAQAARQRALMRQAVKRAQLAGGPRVAAAPAASAGGDSEGSDDSDGDEDEEDAEQGGSPARAGGKRPAGKGKAGAEAERERKRCVCLEAPREVVPHTPSNAQARHAGCAACYATACRRSWRVSARSSTPWRWRRARRSWKARRPRCRHAWSRWSARTHRCARCVLL